MASSIALRRATNSLPLLERVINGSTIRPVTAAPCPWAVRSFNTNTQMTTYDDDERSVDVDRRDRGVSRRRDAFPGYFSGKNMTSSESSFYKIY